ncbi:MAG TPA: PQQ-binding-like beta-propeller repeat protein [Fimbriimonadaceae bacterium]
MSKINRKLFLSFIATALAASSLAQLQSGSPWPKFQANAQNTAVGLGSGCTGNLKWVNSTGSASTSSPAIGSDGTLFLGESSNVVALNGSTGKQEWIYKGGTSTYFVSSPAIGRDGTIYIGSLDFSLYSFNGATGAKNWTFPTAGAIYSSPTIGSDGTVYFGSDDNNVYAVNGTTGAQVWSFATPGPVDSSPALGSDGTIYVGSSDGNLYAINPSSGQANWSYNAGGSVYSLAIGSNGTVYFYSSSGAAYALNGATGALLWTYNLKTGFQYGATETYYSGPAIGSNGTVYFGTTYQDAFLDSIFNVVALNGTTGSLVFNTQIGDWQGEPAVMSSPSIDAAGNVYVGIDGTVVSLASNGKELWASQLQNDQIWSNIALDGAGTAFFTTEFGKVYALTSGGLIGISSSSSVVGGHSTTATVTLASNAGPSGVTVYLGAILASVPTSVTVPPGSNKVSFPVTTYPVPVENTLTIVGSNHPFSQLDSLVQTVSCSQDLLPAALTLLRLTTPTITGGTTEKGAVYFNGVTAPLGTTVTIATLQSGSPLVTMPATVSFPPNSSAVNFDINTSPVSATTAVTLSASDGVNPTQTVVLTLTPAPLASLAAAPTAVIGGANSQVTINLNGKAGSSGNTVSLASNNAAVVVPATEQVSSGNSSVSFPVTTQPVATSVVVSISATFNGVTKTANLTVESAALSSLRLTAPTMIGGNSMNVAVYLNGKAPTAGSTVNLSSNNAAVTVASVETVPAGVTAFAFPISSSGVDSSTAVTLTATKGPVTLHQTVTVIPATVSSLVVAPKTVLGGQSFKFGMYLTGKIGPSGLMVSLKSSSGNVLIPATYKIAAGAISASFSVSTTAVTTSTPVTLTATVGSSSWTTTLTLSS